MQVSVLLFPAILMKIHQKADKKVVAGVSWGVPKDAYSMKVDTNLTLVKGQAEACTGPPQASRVTREAPPPEFELLISQENQQAHRLDPSSLTEARSLLLEVTRRLSRAPGEALAQVHLLKSPCLVRLP